MMLKQGMLSVFLLFGAASGLRAQAPAPVAPIGVGNVMALQGGPELMDPTTLKFTFPIGVRHKAGVGIDFDATLLFNADPGNPSPFGTNAGVAFTALDSSGAIDLSNVWTLGLTSGNSQPILTATESVNFCGYSNTGGQLFEYTYTNPIFSDKYGVLRQFPFVFVDASECSQNQYFFSGQGANSSTNATDGSGINVWGTGQPPTAPVFTVYYPDGSSQTVSMFGYAQEHGPPPPASLVLAQDADGNQITTNSAGTSVVDTLGQTVLSGMTISSGSVTSWGTLSYLNSAGATINTKPSYVTYTKSNLNCPGVAEISSSGNSLLDHLTLPDGRQYSFTYESAYAGSVTGRLQKITLPSGGSISYSYAGLGCSSGAQTLTRILNDNNGNSSTWTYTLGTNGSGQNTLTTVDPAGTSTLITYEAVQLQTGPDPYTSGRYLEASRVTTDNKGKVLNTIVTSYVGTPSSSNPPILPLTSSTVTTSIPDSTGVSAQSVTSYNTIGQVAEKDTYDFGKVGGPVGPLLSKVVTSYPFPPGACHAHSGCPPDPGTFPGSLTTYDASGTLIHKSIPTYNTDATLSQVQQWVAGGTYLTTKYQYNGNGTLSAVIDPNGSYVQMTNMQCNNAYPGGTSKTVKNAAGTQTATLTTSATWDCVEGVPISTTDANGHQTTLTYNDPLFRIDSSTDWLGNKTTYAYPTATSNTSETVLTFNSGNSTQDSLVNYDGLSRPILNQTRQSPSATTFDTVGTTYDSYGRPYSTSLPYSAAANIVNTSVAKSTTTYDALNRPLIVTSAAGATTQYTYAANATDTLITSGPAPSGENPKKRQLEYNALGQLTSVCEITTALQQHGPCVQTTAETGYFTQYIYDGDLLHQVIQNVQTGGSPSETRTMTYDGLGRKLSETIPETGVSTFVYDSDATGICSGSFPGDQIKSTDAMTNITCATYDNQHRQLSTTVVSGTYASVTPQSNYVYDAATVNGTAMQNVAGALAEAYTCTGSCASKITDAGFTLTPETSNGNNTGRLTSQIYEATPHSNGYSHMLATSYPNGALGQLWGAGTGYTMPYVQYGVDGEGRLTTANDTRYQGSLVTATTYNVAGEPLTVSLANGDTDTLPYDSYYRPTGFTFSVAGSSPFTLIGGITLNTNGSVSQMKITDSSDTSKNQTCNYSADDLNRLGSANCGTPWPQTFAYDPFGNISKSSTGGATNYGATYTGTHNQVTGGTTATYDANGNQKLNTAGSFTWNAAAQVVTANAGSGGAATATYDALGRMVETVSGSNNTQFVYSPLGTQYAVVQNGTLARGTVPLPGGDTAVYSTTGSTTALSYIRRMDMLGSSRLATTWTHTVYSKEAYAPYGEPYNEAGTADRSFTGQGSDLTQGANLYDFQFRKLDDTAGRWLSPDPYGWNAVDLSNPQSLNRYAYAENSPLTNVDPLGLATISIVTGYYCTGTGTHNQGSYTINCYVSFITYNLPDTGYLPSSSAGWVQMGPSNPALYTLAIRLPNVPDKPAPIDPAPKPWKIHGNWCGPDWTGGRAGSYDPTIDAAGGYAPPVDAEDAKCETHDKCYYSCRAGNACNPGGRASCFAACDSNLASGTLYDFSWSGQKINLVMTIRGSMGSWHSSESNSSSCPVTH